MHAQSRPMQARVVCMHAGGRTCLTRLGSGRVPQRWWRVGAAMVVDGDVGQRHRGLPWQYAYIRTTGARLNWLLPGRCNNGAAAPRELAPLHHLWANTDASYRLSRIHTTMQYTQPCCTHWRTSHKLCF